MLVYSGPEKADIGVRWCRGMYQFVILLAFPSRPYFRPLTFLPHSNILRNSSLVYKSTSLVYKIDVRASSLVTAVF